MTNNYYEELKKRRQEQMAKATEARKAKLAAETPEQRLERLQAAKDAQGTKTHFRGRKKIDKEKPKGDLTVQELKKLFANGAADAVKCIWEIIHFSKSEHVRLQAAQWWIERTMGKMPAISDGHSSGTTITVITGVPERKPGPDDAIDMTPRVPKIWHNGDSPEDED